MTARALALATPAHVPSARSDEPRTVGASGAPGTAGMRAAGAAAVFTRPDWAASYVLDGGEDWDMVAAVASTSPIEIPCEGVLGGWDPADSEDLPLTVRRYDWIVVRDGQVVPQPEAQEVLVEVGGLQFTPEQARTLAQAILDGLDLVEAARS